MSNKTHANRKGKKYTPRPQKFSSINAALTAQHSLDESQQHDLIEYSRAALERIRTAPMPTREDVVALKAAFEIAARIADTSSGGDVAMGLIEDALRCVQHCMVRKVITGKYRFTGDELRMIEPALDLHDEIVRMATCGQMREAVNFLREHEYRTTLIKEVA